MQRLTYYRVAEILYNPCHSELLLKAGGGPFVEALSNIEDNRLRSTNSIPRMYANNMSIYPQPASDYINLIFYLTSSSLVSWKILDIITLAEVSVGYCKPGKNYFRIHLMDYKLKSGIYFIKINSKYESFVGNLVIVK